MVTSSKQARTVTKQNNQDFEMADRDDNSLFDLSPTFSFGKRAKLASWKGTSDEESDGLKQSVSKKMVWKPIVVSFCATFSKLRVHSLCFAIILANRVMVEQIDQKASFRSNIRYLEKIL